VVKARRGILTVTEAPPLRMVMLIQSFTSLPPSPLLLYLHMYINMHDMPVFSFLIKVS
jgi:hypothetical protein